MTAQPPDPGSGSTPVPGWDSGFPPGDPVADPERTRRASYGHSRGSTGMSITWALVIGVVIVLVAGFFMAYAVIYLSGG